MAKDDKTSSNRNTETDAGDDVFDTVPGPVRPDNVRENDRGPMGPIGADLGRPLDDDELARRAEEIGLTEASQPGQGPTNDDLAPETLIREDGARHQFEPGERTPVDRDLEIVDAEEIGAGEGLDEAEQARLDPLDGKQWTAIRMIRSDRSPESTRRTQRWHVRSERINTAKAELLRRSDQPLVALMCLLVGLRAIYSWCE
ncbi:hypothetical protein [Halopseudomonas sp.]|uniref:hypothetical protein n=1 Tax=Halopseudomonas sp. TaxID=2901191 RepID=UPI0035671299